jgi:endonuclease/exonuclease/phosphatase family metal-dependent hydrolase
MLQALRPDVVLLQEWNRGTEADLKSWFSVHVDPSAEWNVRMLEQPADKPGLTGGVAIVSRLPLSPAGATPTVAGDTVRSIAAKVRSPLGEIAVASIHLKCCGSASGTEEARRIAEAAAVHASIAGLRANMIAIGGDYNLVGGRAPLDTLAQGLDAGGNLEPAPAMLLGDRLMTTWRDDPSPFSAGRLDYVLTSPSTLGVPQTFVVDTRRLSDGALAMMGLDRTDSAASDHMPLVVDLAAPAPAKK